MTDTEAELVSLKSRLAAAEQRAKDSEAMMIQAAEYGKELLEKNMALESDYEAMHAAGKTRAQPPSPGGYEKLYFANHIF